MSAYVSTIRPVKPSEFREVLAVCDLATFAGKRDAVILLVLMDAGLARSDIELLTVDDVTAEYLMISRGFEAPIMSKRLADALADYIEVRNALEPETNRLFINGQTLRALSGREISHLVANRFRQALVDNTRPYDALRLSFAIKWIEKGGTLADIEPLFSTKHGRILFRRALDPQGRSKRSRAQIAAENQRKLAEVAPAIVQAYSLEGASLKAVAKRFGVSTRKVEAALAMKGVRSRSASEAAVVRYTKGPDGAPVAQRLLDLGLRSFQQEVIQGRALLAHLAHVGTLSLPDIYRLGFSRRQYHHARRWLTQHGYADVTRSTNVILVVTPAGRLFLDGLTLNPLNGATHEVHHNRP